MQEAAATYVLDAYIDHLACTRKNMATNRPIMAKTLVQHLMASAQFLRLATQLPVAIYANPQSASPRLLPWLGDIIHARQQWQQPLPKRLPCTYRMFQALNTFIQLLMASNCSAWLDRDAAVFDWSCLGIFTGSRSGEYAQTVAKRGQFACVPNSWAAPTEWKNTPLAFIVADFAFCDVHMRLVKLSILLDATAHASAFIHVRFCFDESSTNFTIHKHKAGKGFLCPVRAALSILRRAHLLQVPPLHPVGVFRTHPSGSFTYLQSSDVITVMRKLVDLAHPDPTHCYRIHRAAVVTHSNHVTAAVALCANGRPIPDIAFRLRWKPEAVEHHIRECSQLVDNLTIATVQGAYCI